GGRGRVVGGDEGEAGAGIQAEPRSEGLEEGGGVLEGVASGFVVGLEPGGIFPERRAVGAGLQEEGPAGERFAGVVFAGGFEDDGAGAVAFDEGVGAAAGVVELGRAEGGGGPFGAFGAVGDEGGFAAHGEGDAGGFEQGLDGGAASLRGWGAGGFAHGGGEEDQASFSMRMSASMRAVAGWSLAMPPWMGLTLSGRAEWAT